MPEEIHKIGNVSQSCYEQDVSELRDVVEQQTRGQFSIGDRALEIEPMRPRGGANPDGAWPVDNPRRGTPGRRCVSVALHVDLPWILEVAQRAGHKDPAPDDLGVPIAAVARHRAELLEHPVYGGPYARAAALVHTLGKCRWLEHSNLTVACAVAVMYLNASNIPVDPTCDQLAALARELYDPRCTAARITQELRTWHA